MSHLPSQPNYPAVSARALARQLGYTQATTCYVATSPDLVGVRGFYFADCNVNGGETPHMRDDVMAECLWQVSTELTKDFGSSCFDGAQGSDFGLEKLLQIFSLVALQTAIDLAQVRDRLGWHGAAPCSRSFLLFFS